MAFLQITLVISSSFAPKLSLACINKSGCAITSGKSLSIANIIDSAYKSNTSSLICFPPFPLTIPYSCPLSSITKCCPNTILSVFDFNSCKCAKSLSEYSNSKPDSISICPLYFSCK